MLLNAETKKTHIPNLVKLKNYNPKCDIKFKKNDMMMTDIPGQLDQSPIVLM